jgi:hypothetical protein
MRRIPGLVPVTVTVAVTGVGPVAVTPSAGPAKQTLTVYEPPDGPLDWQTAACAWPGARNTIASARLAKAARRATPEGHLL